MSGDLLSNNRIALVLPTICLTGTVSFGHSPVLDGDLSDWCLDTTASVDNRAVELTCPIGTEVVWWDAFADAAVNDLFLAATTYDETHLYWAVRLTVADPASLPFAELAIDVAPGGNHDWWDPQGNLRSPGHCSLDTDRLCTEDQDCHFCAVSTVYTGTVHERPAPCGTTATEDLCGDGVDPADVCIRNQTCLGLATAPPVPFAGALSAPVAAPDYLLVYDVSRWLVGVCDAVNLLRNDNGTWVEIPRPVPDPLCPNPTWRFALNVSPGLPGRPDDAWELAVPWEAFDCAGCAPFGPGDDYRFTLQINRGTITLDYAPDGPIEDVMTEAIPGITTATPNPCGTPGTATTICELADGSADAFVPLAPRAPGGEVSGLILTHHGGGSITLTWEPSCSNSDIDYAVYEGEIGFWYSHAAPASGAVCSTNGAATATFDAAQGDRYYLVVPRDASVEGSYGHDAEGAERPPSTTWCAAQSLGGC